MKYNDNDERDYGIEEMKSYFSPEYKRIKKLLKGNKGALVELKGFYSYWLASVDRLEPENNEPEVVYEKRINAIIFKLKEKSNRYKLEFD